MTLAPAQRLRPALWFAGLLLTLLFVERLVTTLPEFSRHSALPAAVTFDLLIGIPLLYYLFLVRRYRLPVAGVVAAFGAALALGYWLIPAGQQQYLGWASRSLGLLEAGVVVMAVINVRRLVRAYATAAQTSADFLANLHAAFAQVFGRALGPLVSEVAMFRYALLSWRARPEVGPAQTAFSNHRESAFTAVLVTLSGVALIETAGVHLLVSRWSHTAAVVMLVLDAYTLTFLLAHLRAVALRPTVLKTGQLTVRVGFVWRCTVPVSAIVATAELSDAPAAAPDTLNLAKPLLTPPNVLLTLAEPVPVTGLYGLRRQVRCLALYVDDRPGFLAALRQHQAEAADQPRN